MDATTQLSAISHRPSAQRATLDSRFPIPDSLFPIPYDQVQVPEFVPEITVFEGRLVGETDVTPSGEGFEQGQVGRARFVEARNQSIDHANAAFRSNYEVGPALRGAHGPVGRRDGFERAHDGCTDRHDSMVSRARSIHRLRRASSDSKALSVRQLSSLEARHSRVQDLSLIHISEPTRL